MPVIDLSSVFGTASGSAGVDGSSSSSPAGGPTAKVPGLGNIGQIGSEAGGAVSDIFAAQGDLAEAKQYGYAAGLAGANEQFTEQMTRVKSLQQQREVYQTIGAQQAGYAGGNIAEAGSAMDVMRSSIQQGALSNYLINYQGVMQESAYREQQQAYQQMADTAKSAATAGYIGAGIKGLTAIAQLAMM